MRTPTWGFLGSRLARRLFALFVLASLLPMALSGWLSNTAVAQIADALNLNNRAQTTRQTSRQVFDRLMAGRTLLAALPNAVPAPAAPPPAGLGPVFRNLALLGADGRLLWSAKPDTDLPGAWWSADSGVVEGRPPPRRSLSEGVDVRLRVAAGDGGPARQFIGAYHLGVLGWIAELEPAYLWAPLNDTAEDSAWRVVDARGRGLRSITRDDYPRGGALQPQHDDDEAGTVESRSVLFLGAEFGAGDWTFVQRGPRPQVRWQGALLTVWLGLVALGTLLAIALLSQWQIRRALVPLQQLTDGARRLSAGATDTRVAIHRDDEIGVLAGAFNDMAAHVQAQFNALEGLAAIDRDILAGVALHTLAERVVRQLAELYPGAGVAVSWCDAAARLKQVLLQADAEPLSVGMSTWKMSIDQAEAYAGRNQEAQCLPGGNPGLPEPSGEPWLVAVCQPDTRCLVLLPLRQQDHTNALVSVALASPPSDEQLQPARELRDRLAVAFSAHAREQELVHRAVHDSLTGLSNRYGLHARLDALLSETGSTPRVALLFIDLDHFKDVNDRHGHGAGDELLCLAASRLRACAPTEALVARQGGDEFAIVLPHADAAAAGAVAVQALRALNQPFALSEGEHILGASVGIALSPDHGPNREELLRCADIALYAAKAAGRGQHVVFTDELNAATRDRVQLLAELRLALERSEFVVHYQPRVRPNDGVVASAEALIRWQHPKRGLLYPGAFIELAESSGLIDGIGRRVLDAACKQMARWRARGVRIERVSVNVSAIQLASGDLPRHVLAALERYGLPGDALELEVTESLLVGDVSAASAQLSELRRSGVTIALDDFGTGYSSLATLRKLPVDVMKIDRSFVTDLGSDEGALAVTRAIVALARSLRLKLVAEGIETEEQAAVLRSMGCDELQGYLFGKPLSASQFARLPGLQRDPNASASKHWRDAFAAAAEVV